MRHWCFYTRVVSYLERLEAGQVQNTPTGAYLVWRDDDGPWMVAGPDIDWFRGDGPLPDIEGLILSGAARVHKRSAPNSLSTRAKQDAASASNRAPNASEGSASVPSNSREPQRAATEADRQAPVPPGSESINTTQQQALFEPNPPASHATRKANKRHMHFLRSAQICSHQLTPRRRQQSCGRQPALNTANHHPSIHSDRRHQDRCRRDRRQPIFSSD